MNQRPEDKKENIKEKDNAHESKKPNAEESQRETIKIIRIS